ncbi:MAG: flavodoxin [Endomicrobia bacterium]|nr:flavodoxin [Endomicrobiia bacterium]MCL2506164.1 flavodoxin [Endomicrobiia bacterium]
MVKYAIYAVLAVVAVCLIIAGFHNFRVHLKNKKEMSPYMKTDIKFENNLGRVLVVYYSLSGNTRAVAENIQAKTGADIFEIKTKTPFPSGPKLYIEVKNQIKTGEYPELQGDIPDFEKYDIIFVGSPIWWYTAATPVLAFLEQADFKGRKVVPFATQGSNPGSFIQDFKERAKNAVVLEGRLFNNLSKKYDKAVDNKISAWLNELPAK